MNYKDIMSEYIKFQPNKSYIFLSFLLKFDSDHLWLPNLEWITTGGVIIFRLLSLVFSVLSQAFCSRFDCWGQPFSCGPCQRDLWGTHVCRPVPTSAYTLLMISFFKKNKCIIYLHCVLQAARAPPCSLFNAWVCLWGF